jgi:hypothetical protein
MQHWQRIGCGGIVWLVVGVMLVSQAWAHRLQGPFVGYRTQYSAAPAGEDSVQVGPYRIVFSAFDMGHEVHIIAYARYVGSGEYYQDMVRVSILDPDGNAFTMYRDHVVEVIDEPIRWEYRQPGVHAVDVQLLPVQAGRQPATASFTMSLERSSPTSAVLTFASGAVVVTALVVVVLRRKRSSRAQTEG